MPPSRPIIVDTNILFSALLRHPSRFADVLLQTEHHCFICEQVLVELFKHKEKIVKASRLPEDDILRWYHILLRRLTLYKEVLIAPEHRAAAYALCQPIDPSDTPHVALTLHLDGLLWTGDTTLKDGLRANGFTDFFEP
jgi:predicted nucleic acid-binding protein